MRTHLFALLAGSAGLAGVCLGQARIEMQVSPAGAETWSSAIAPAAGASVDVRMSLTYTGSGSPLGLASLYAQPTISNWRATGNADTLSALVNGGEGSNTSTPVGGVPNVANQYGRILPYANRATNGTQQRLTGITETVNNIGYLRIAQAYATDPVGTGFNQTGGRGIPLTQVNNVGRTAAEPAFNTATANVIVFKFRINLSTDVVGRVMQVTIPAAGLGNLNLDTGVREVRWFANMTESTGSLSGAATIVPATITLVPAPGAAGLLAVGGLVMGRRRRK